MAFPTIEGVGTLTQAVNSASHNVPYPTIAGGILADDLLILVGALDVGTNTITAWPAGWTELGQGDAGASTNINAHVGCAYKWAAGGETGTATVTIGTSEHGSWSMLCIRGADAATAPEVSAGANASSADPDPASLAPSWGADDTLWLAFEGNDSTASPTAPPANYTDVSTVPSDGTSGAGHSVASRELNAASEDPGAFTMTAEQWGAYTIAVKPAGAAGPTPVSATRALSYERLNAVAASRALAYGRLNVVSATRALAYSRLAAVSATRALAYARKSEVSASRSLVYERAAAVAAERSLAYERVATISTTRGLAYVRLNAVAAARELAYQRVAGVAATRALRYERTSTTTSTRALSYRRVATVTSTRQLAYGRSALIGSQRRVVYGRGESTPSVPEVVMKKSIDQRAFEIHPIGRRR